MFNIRGESVNKDFFTKPISLGDLKNIDIKNKKEWIIGGFAVLYVVAFLVIGSFLLSDREEVIEQYDKKKTKYELLQRSESEDVLSKKIEELSFEKDKLTSVTGSVTSNEYFRALLKEFKKDSPVSWKEEYISVKTKDEYDIYSIDIKNFSCSLSQAEEFLKYVSEYEANIVRVSTFDMNKKEATGGNMTGSIKLEFYFKKMSA